MKSISQYCDEHADIDARIEQAEHDRKTLNEAIAAQFATHAIGDMVVIKDTAYCDGREGKSFRVDRITACATRYPNGVVMAYVHYKGPVFRADGTEGKREHMLQETYKDAI